MGKYARINDGSVVEVFTVPAGCALSDCFHPSVAELFVECPDSVTVGSTISGEGEWTIVPEADEEPPDYGYRLATPQEITPRQGELVLSRRGLLDQVNAMLAGMGGQAGVEARIEFSRATYWRRDWPLLISLASALSLSAADIDQMFIEGAQL